MPSLCDGKLTEDIFKNVHGKYMSTTDGLAHLPLQELTHKLFAAADFQLHLKGV